MRSPVLFTLMSISAFAQNWPAFRGPMGSGVNDGTNPPTRWDAEKNTNIVWKTPIPGLSVSSPIVWGEKVFLVTSISSDPNSEFRHGLFGDVTPAKDLSEHTWKVYCLDRKTGKILWEQVAHKGVPKTKRHPKSSFSSPSPVTNGQVVIAYFGSEGIYAYDMNGKALWQKDLGVIDTGWFFDPDYQWTAGSSPTIYKNMVFVQADRQKNSFLAALDVHSGKEIWRVERDEIPGWSTPVVFELNGRAQLITNSVKKIRSHDPATGKLIWELGGNSEITATTPIVGLGLIFIANGYPPIQPIYAIKWEAQGDITLKESEDKNAGIEWSKKRGGPYLPTPLLYGDLLYICSNSGILTTYQAKTGEKVYQERVGGKSGAFSASPVAADGRVYFASEDGDVFVVKAGPKYETLSDNPMGEVLMGTPAISRDMMIVRGMKNVYGIGEKPAVTASR
jgi:outer membrane protein assembly factor BamB